MINAWPDGLAKSTSKCRFDRGVGGEEGGAGVKSYLGDAPIYKVFFKTGLPLAPERGILLKM